MTSLTTLYLRFNRISVVEPGIGNLKVGNTINSWTCAVKSNIYEELLKENLHGKNDNEAD